MKNKLIITAIFITLVAIGLVGCHRKNKILDSLDNSSSTEIVDTSAEQKAIAEEMEAMENPEVFEVYGETIGKALKELSYTVELDAKNCTATGTSEDNKIMISYSNEEGKKVEYIYLYIADRSPTKDEELIDEINETGKAIFESMEVEYDKEIIENGLKEIESLGKNGFIEKPYSEGISFTAQYDEDSKMEKGIMIRIYPHDAQ